MPQVMLKRQLIQFAQTLNKKFQFSVARGATIDPHAKKQNFVKNN